VTQTSENALTMVEIVRRHFEPTLEMLRETVRACPDELWDARDEGAPFWQYAYHTLFWLDFWLTDSPEAFQAPSFHTGDALIETGQTPSVPFSRAQIDGYLEQVDAKCTAFFEELTLDRLTQEAEFFERMWAVGDRILMQLRHIQHHVGHMNCILKRKTGKAPEWVGFNE
jgi:hypothetical protein